MEIPRDMKGLEKSITSSRTNVMILEQRANEKYAVSWLAANAMPSIYSGTALPLGKLGVMKETWSVPQNDVMVFTDFLS
ncbi:hypothetical protein EYF80_043700 [Liparis tanakae]|uniref:Uncharacterized protein n=1 Tax=Liparis tanakae TaxID=230148 RepID=A0A4Z2FZ27_9TELE|nr:hypothetical protein EYF80_043700 [Liparis tanakae]